MEQNCHSLTAWQGLYRVSGSKTRIQSLFAAAFDKQKTPHLDEEDVETVTGLLKFGLQSLAEPLFTFDRFDGLVESSSMSAGTAPNTARRLMLAPV